MFRRAAKNLLLFYAAGMPDHRGKWRIIEHGIRSFGIERGDQGGVFECSRQGLRWRLDTRCAVQRRLYYHGALDPYDEREFLGRIGTGSVMLDIGSYFGYYGLLAAKRGAQVFAFEPARANFSDLEHQCKANASLDVSIHRLALSDRAGIGHMSVAPSEQRGTGQIEAAPGQEEETEEIAMVTLDAFLIERSLRRVDAMKVDVEGAELKVLAGGAAALSRWKPLLLIEFNPARLRRFGVTQEAFLGALRNPGYRVMRASRSGLQDFNELRSKEEYCNLLCIAE